MSQQTGLSAALLYLSVAIILSSLPAIPCVLEGPGAMDDLGARFRNSILRLIHFMDRNCRSVRRVLPLYLESNPGELVSCLGLRVDRNLGKTAEPN